jgi:hypothetical protein
MREIGFVLEEEEVEEEKEEEEEGMGWMVWVFCIATEGGSGGDTRAEALDFLVLV